MREATSQLPRLRLAVAPGVPPSQLSALLALQRAEEPDIALKFSEVSAGDLVDGLHEGRYDVGVSLEASADPTVTSQPLWTESMAVAMPLRSPLLSQTDLTIGELEGHPVYRWRAEACPLLDKRLASLLPLNQQSIHQVTSFGMLAIWVAAGYGVGLTGQARIERAHGWGIVMRPLADGPYEIVTHLQRPRGRANPVAERFGHRALQVAEAGTS